MIADVPRVALLTPAESARTYRDVYEAFHLRVAVDPSIDAVLDVADAITGCAIVLTDAVGNRLQSSRPIDPARRFDPPPITELVGLPVACDGSLVATSIARPGVLLAWILDDPNPDDLTSTFVAMLTAEFASLLDRFAFRWIPDIWMQRNHLVHLMIEPASADRVRTLASTLDHDVDRIHHVVVIQSLSGIVAQRFAMSIGPRLRDYGIIGPVDDHLVVVVGDPARLHPLIEALRTTTDLGPIRVGVSSAHPDGVDLSRAHRQAITACDDIAPDDGIAISWFEERNPIGLMVRLSDAETTDRFIDDALGPLLHYDGPHRDEFIETLRMWLDSTGSLDATARTLNIHRSTLVYRLRRIRELLGHDLRDPEKRFEMAVALRMLDRIGSSSD